MRSRSVLASLLALGLAATLSGAAQASADSPSSGSGGTPDARVRLTGELFTTAVEKSGDRQWFAVRVGDRFVPVEGDHLARIAPMSRVTVDVGVPQPVADAAAADRELKVPTIGGPVTHDLTPRDLRAASDATPASATSSIGEATTDAAFTPGTPPLEVTDVVTSAAAQPAGYVPATRAITYIEVTPKGVTREPVTSAAAAGQVAATDSYWQDNSRSELKVAAPSMRSHYVSSYSCVTDGPFAIWTEAADRIGWTDAPNSSLVIKFPQSTQFDCGYGWGTLGVSPNDTGMLSVSDIAWPVLAHELGHNMSFGHANWLTCPGRSDAPFDPEAGWPSDCQEWEYDDGFDVMSYSAPDFAPMLSSPQALRVTTLESAATVTAGNGTTEVTLKPLAGRTGTRAVVATNAITGETYYVEYRTAAGRDAVTATDSTPGVRVLRHNPWASSSVLLDPTPNANPDANAVLTPGTSLTSHDGRITVRTVSATSTAAVVRVENNTTVRTFTNSVRPSISGSRGVGKTLTAERGTWSPTPSGYSYQWKRNGIAIPGATSRTYTASLSDAGRYLSVRVTPRRTGYTSAGLHSSRVGIPIHSTVRPYLSGTAKVGRTLYVYVGSWTPKPTSYAYRWYRDGSPISGATAKTYTLRSADRGAKVQAKVTARRTGYSTGWRYTYSKLVG